MIWTFIDTWIVVGGVLSALCCALLGNFLVLRKMSMMGDAISHAVLPGLAIAFLITSSRTSLPMFIGAALAGIITAVFTQLINRFGKVDEGASMGVVFTTLFALGLVMLVQAADSVDLDPGCVLYGAIELVPLDTVLFGGREVPRVVLTLGGMLLMNLLFVWLFFKELKISSFDPELATTLGLNANLMHYGLMTLVAMTTVACFESVGSILVIAMLVVPPATARLLTDRLISMVWVSAGLAVFCAVVGHVAAIVVPGWFGADDTSTAGMMAAVAGLVFLVAMLVAPRHGVISKLVHRTRLGLRILEEDVLGLLYRIEEYTKADVEASYAVLQTALTGSDWQIRSAVRGLNRQGRVTSSMEGIRLTDDGRRQAKSLIRSHRLWESYLFENLEVPADHVHKTAEKLEHVTGAEMLRELTESTADPAVDPHGKRIPEEAVSDDDSPSS